MAVVGAVAFVLHSRLASSSGTAASQRQECGPLRKAGALSEERLQRCCQEFGLACASARAVLYNCQAGRASWQKEWSSAKQKWCCKEFAVACPRPNAGGWREPLGPFNCTLGSSEAWSARKREACCRGTACRQAPLRVPGEGRGRHRCPPSPGGGCAARRQQWRQRCGRSLMQGFNCSVGTARAWSAEKRRACPSSVEGVLKADLVPIWKACALLAAGLLLTAGGPSTWSAGTALLLALALAEPWTWQHELWSGPVNCAALHVAALAASLLALRGPLDGSQLLLGAFFGALAAYCCGAAARAVGPGLAMLWYSVCALAGALALGFWPHVALPALQPLLGGFLAALGAALLLPAAASEGWQAAASGLLSLTGPGAPLAQAGMAVAGVLLQVRLRSCCAGLLCTCLGTAGRAVCLLGAAAIHGQIVHELGLLWPVLLWAVLSTAGTQRQLRAALQGPTPSCCQRLEVIWQTILLFGEEETEGQRGFCQELRFPRKVGLAGEQNLIGPFGPRPDLPARPRPLP